MNNEFEKIDLKALLFFALLYTVLIILINKYGYVFGFMKV